MTRVAVVGAGLAGLAAADELARRDVDVVVFDGAPHPGGVVRSLVLDGCRFERGPNTLPASARTFRELCVRHGLGSELVGSSEKSKARWVWFRGRLVRVPLAPPHLLTTPLFSLGTKFKIAREPLRRWKEPAGEEPSFGALLRDRIGDEPTDRLAAAFVRGIYAGDVDRLGAKSAFPRVWNGLKQHGSLIRFARAAGAAARTADLPGPKLAPGRLLGLAGGLDQLPKAMAASLGERLRLGTAVEALERVGARWRVVTANGADDFDRVILATPAPATSRLVADVADDEVRAFLDGIGHASLEVAHATFDRAALPSVPEGFGHLVPPCEDGPDAPPVLGTIYAANLFDDRAPEHLWNLSAFYAPGALPEGTEARAGVVAEHFARSQGWSTTPPVRSLLVDVWRDVIPQATVGHAARRDAALVRLAAEAPGLVLAGTFTGGVAVENVLERGLAAAHEAIADLDG